MLRVAGDGADVQVGRRAALQADPFAGQVGHQVRILRRTETMANALGAQVPQRRPDACRGQGGAGAAKLAEAVERACADNKEENFRFLYDSNLPSE